MSTGYVCPRCACYHDPHGPCPPTLTTGGTYAVPTPQSQIESLQRALAAAKADIQAVIARVKVVTGVAYSSASAAAMRLEEDRDCARARTLEIRFLLFSQVKTLTEIKRRLYAEVGKQEHDRVARRCAEKLEAQAKDALPNAAKELSEAARSIREGFGL